MQEEVPGQAISFPRSVLKRIVDVLVIPIKQYLHYERNYSAPCDLLDRKPLTYSTPPITNTNVLAH